jgi:uncharacterized membrane-anchored protein
MKIRLLEPSCSMWTGRTDRQEEAKSRFRNFANAPNTKTGNVRSTIIVARRVTIVPMET